MLLRLREGNAPPPATTKRLRLRVVGPDDSDPLTCFLEGVVEDDEAAPFVELAAQLVVAGGVLETPPIIQNKFQFSCRWTLPRRMKKDLVAALYFMPRRDQLLAATVAVPHPVT